MVADDCKCDHNILHVLVFDADAVAVRPVSLVLIDVSNCSAADLNIIVNAHHVACDTQFSTVYRSADFRVYDAEFLFQLSNCLTVPDKDIFVHYLSNFPFQLQGLYSVLLNGEAVLSNSGMASIERDYDENGNVVVERYYNAEGQQAASPGMSRAETAACSHVASVGSNGHVSF